MEPHSRIRDLMVEVMQSTGEPRQEAWRELVRLLSVHETAEEEVVHPAGANPGQLASARSR